MLQVVAALRADAPAQAFNVGDPTGEIAMLDLARRCAAATGLDPAEAVTAGAGSGGALARAVPDVDRVLAHARPALPPFTALDDGLVALAAWVGWLTDRA